MPLINGRFDDISGEDAKALLGAMEGPFLELELSLDSGDPTSCDVLAELFMALRLDPRFARLFPTKEELESWRRFKRERGEGAKEIGEFVYGPDENPWRRENHP